MKIYERKPKKVEALQFTGQNVNEIAHFGKKFVPGYEEIKQDGNTIQILSFLYTKTMFKDNYIVHVEGNIDVYNAFTFHENFQEAFE
jgi:carbohydrate-selective porin OprB